MAENKKGYILYADQKSLFDKLPDEIAGKLIKFVFSYVNDENPQTDDLLLQIAFEPIKLQLKRDLVKWESKVNKCSESGKKGMKKRWGKITNDNDLIKPITKRNGVKKSITKITDTDNVNVNVTDTKQQADANDLNKRDAFLSNPRRNETFCISNRIKLTDLQAIQDQFLKDVAGKEINDLWSYFNKVYQTGQYDFMIKKMVM